MSTQGSVSSFPEEFLTPLGVRGEYDTPVASEALEDSYEFIDLSDDDDSPDLPQSPEKKEDDHPPPLGALVSPLQNKICKKTKKRRRSDGDFSTSEVDWWRDPSFRPKWKRGKWSIDDGLSSDSETE